MRNSSIAIVEIFDNGERVWRGSLSSFGSESDGKHVKKSGFVLEATADGAVWDTLAADSYRIFKRAGDVEKRVFDDSGVGIDWTTYTDWQDAGNQAFRVTYTVTNNGSETTYTTEALTLYEMVVYPEGGELDPLAESAEIGEVAGWVSTMTQLISPDGNFKVDSSVPALMIGSATAFGTGAGIWEGNDSGTYKWRVGNPSGNFASWNGTTFQVTGTITATAGTIGGFTIGATTITATNLTLDSANQKISLGSSNNIIILDAADSTYRIVVGHATYASAPFSVTKAGELLATNATITGTLKTAVFQKSLVTAYAGSMIVAKSASALDSAATATGTTFSISVKSQAGAPFASGDIIRMTDGTNTTWATVGAASGSGPYSYTATYQSGSSSATYPAGTTVVDYGVSGQGYLYLTADDSDGPYYTVRTHAGSPWSTTTERARMGNLKNAFGIGANNYYGFAAGDYANGNYLRYDPTNGFVIKASAGTVALDSDGLHTDILQIDNNALWLGGGASRYRSAGTVADDNSIGTIAWIDTDNVKVKDSSYASVGVTSSQVSHWLKLTNFGFALPSSATVLGIKVDFLGFASDTLVAAGAYARIVKGGTISGSDQVIPFTTTNPPTAYVEKSPASTTDLWSNTWTYSDVNSSGFGVALYVNGPDTPSGVILSLDHARISVYYQTASGQVLVQTNSNYFDVLRSASTIDFKQGRALAAGLYDRANSDTTVGNTTTETTLYSKSVTANDLAATGGLRLTMTGTWLNNSGSGKTLTLRVKFGATTIFSYGFTLSSNSSTGRFEIGVTLFNTATNAQVANIVAQYFRGGGSTTLVDGYRNKTTAAEDTTSAKTLSVTVQWDAAHANATTTKEMAFLEILP